MIEYIDSLNRMFSEYLSGKSVALVGRSCLDDIEQGEFIDSHDVVVRVHKAVPYTSTDTSVEDNFYKNPQNDPVKAGEFVPERWHPIIGKRVNVFYHRVEHKNDPGYYQNWLTIFRDAGGEWICHDCHRGTGSWQLHFMQNYAPVRYVDWELKGEIVCEIKQKAEAGTIIIADLLRYDLRSLYVTGFPCMMDNFIRKDSPYSHARLRNHPSPQNHIGPQSFANFKYVYEICQDPRVSVDKNMRKLFEMHENNELHSVTVKEIQGEPCEITRRLYGA